MQAERVRLYVRALADLSEDALGGAFKFAVQNCKFIPTIAELRQWAQDFLMIKHQQQARERTKAILALPAKPDDWGFKLDDAWEELQKRAEDRARFELSQPDMEWEEAKAMGMFYKDWALRREVHERNAKGLPLVPDQRAKYHHRFMQIYEAQR